MPEVADAAPPPQQPGTAAVERVIVAPDVPLVYSTPPSEETPAPTADSKIIEERDDEAPTETEEARETALQAVDHFFAPLSDGLNVLRDALADALPSSDAESDGGGLGILPSDGTTSEAASAAVASSEANEETASRPATPSAPGNGSTEDQELFEALLTQTSDFRSLQDFGSLGTGLVQAGMFSQTASAAMLSADAALPSSLSTEPTNRAELIAALGQLPLRFEQNVGQFGTALDFVVRGPGYEAGLSATGATYFVSGATETGEEVNAGVHMSLVGANPNAVGVGQELLPGATNYFIGNDPSQHFTNVVSYASVTYQDVYSGIDLVYRPAPGKQLEHDFVVSPGADAGDIALHFYGTDRVEIDAAGDLLLHTSGGPISQARPFTYQDIDGQRVEVASRFVIDAGGTVGFEVGEHRDDVALVIDPQWGYSTFLGDKEKNSINSVAVDSDGNAYLVGTSPRRQWFLLLATKEFFTVAPDAQTGDDAVVVKLSANGNQLLYQTYVGGTGSDSAADVALVNGGGGTIWATVTGSTDSTNFFTTQGAWQTQRGGGWDAFAFQLNAAGDDVRFSTYLGGVGNEAGNGIAVDSEDRVYVVGSTTGSPFFNPNDAQKKRAPHTLGPCGGVMDAFGVRLTAAGVPDALFILGGNFMDSASAVAVDNAAIPNMYLTGFTKVGEDPLPFPTTQGAFRRDPFEQSEDAFVTKIHPVGGQGGIPALVYSTLFGGSGDE